MATTLLPMVSGVGLKVSGLFFLVVWLLAKQFFGAVYAAAGTMVQLTEDLQSNQMPILLMIMATAYIPSFGWMSTDTTWTQVMSCSRG
ncbi:MULTISPECIES: hypothetical protein [unclassified Corynebacterium]|uniref:hypothetical protein n=1 Tax=unclassified Corynebacterium TaxID=2624378 RepID=UPI00143A533E|nr:MULTISPECIES: hypothetical protein [unclassified Corynebacterium]